MGPDLFWDAPRDLPLGDGAVLLGGFARPAEAALLRALAAVADANPFRRMVTPAIVSTTSSMCRLSPARGSLRRIWLANSWPNLRAHCPHGLVADDDVAGGRQTFDHTRTEREAGIQPYSMADDPGREPVAGVSGAGSWRRPTRLPGPPCSRKPGSRQPTVPLRLQLDAKPRAVDSGAVALLRGATALGRSDAVGLAQHYQGILGLHILAAVTFVAGTFLLTAMLPSLSGEQGSAREQQAVLRRLRRWNRFVTTPAMVLVWVFGLALAAAGGWFVATWLQAKMALVIVLSAIHGMQSAKLRRLRIEGRTLRRPTLRPALVIVLLVAGIVAMVTMKPW